MIYDKLSELGNYGPAFAKAVEIIRNCSPETPCGRIDVDGDDIFASVAEYRTKSPGESIFESHREYIDVQACITGAEEMHFLNIADCDVIREDFANDYIGQMPKAGWYGSVVVHPGDAVVFFPQDAHRPQMRACHGPEHVKKVVVKIRCKKLKEPG